MSNTIIQHHMIDPATGVLSKVAWGGNALQTVNITRNTPRDPQQAIGKRGIVDYTSQPVTSDVSLECILTEQTDEATALTSIYKHADTNVSVGEESYVLTSCNVGFQAGSPATVSYGYITASEASAFAVLGAAPTVLTEGEEAAFAVVMGSDGSGVDFVSNVAGDSLALPSGVQSVSYSASISREQVLDVRSSSPILFTTTYPLDLSMSLEIYKQDSVVDALTGVGVKLASGTNHVDGATGNPGSLSKLLVLATGLAKTQSSESVNVGGYLTYTYEYTAADILIPLDVPA